MVRNHLYINLELHDIYQRVFWRSTNGAVTHVQSINSQSTRSNSILSSVSFIPHGRSSNQFLKPGQCQRKSDQWPCCVLARKHPKRCPWLNRTPNCHWRCCVRVYGRLGWRRYWPATRWRVLYWVWRYLFDALPSCTMLTMKFCWHLPNWQLFHSWFRLSVIPDQPAQVICETCSDAYCEVCFAAQHRKGSRKRHAVRSLDSSESSIKKAKVNNGNAVPRSVASSSASSLSVPDLLAHGTAALAATPGISGTATTVDVDDNSVFTVASSFMKRVTQYVSTKMKVDGEKACDPNDEDAEGDLNEISEHWKQNTLNSTTAIKRDPFTATLSAQPVVGTKVGEWFVERARYIPLRLSLSERKYLRLLEAALSVSEYTDRIDTIGFGLSKAKRIVHQIRELCAIMSGLVLAADYKQGQELFQDRDFEANSEFYQQIFELGRRHKIMNPEKMRTTYGKLIYLLQVSLINPSELILGERRFFRIVKHQTSRNFSTSLVFVLSKRCISC